MKKLGFIFITLLVISSPQLTSAEFYKYRDSNGVLRFTDNLAEVPADQRPKVTSYQQVEDFQPPADRLESKPTPKAEQQMRDPDTEKAPGSQAAHIASRYQELNQKRAALDQEYNNLISAQQTIAEERKSAATKEEKQAVNLKVQQLNERIADFEQKRSAFEKEVREFNESQNP